MFTFAMFELALGVHGKASHLTCMSPGYIFICLKVHVHNTMSVHIAESAQELKSLGVKLILDLIKAEIC